MKTLSIILAVSAGAAVAAPPTYTVEYLGPATHLNSVNNAGQAVGWRLTDGAVRAWVGAPGEGVANLPLPRGFDSSWALDISDSGVIVGSVDQFGMPELGTAVRWVPGGSAGYTVELIGTLSGYPDSVATGINEFGDMVGYSISSGGQGDIPIWFNYPRMAMDLSVYGLEGPAVDVNEERQVLAGRTILDLDSMRLMTLPVPHLDGSTLMPLVYTHEINNLGQVVGHVGLEDGTQVNVRWTSDVGWETLLPFATVAGSAYGINDLGQVVMDDGLTSVYVWLPDEGAFDLEALVSPTAAAWVFIPTFGSDINNEGQIGAIAANLTTRQSGAVLLTPLSVCDADFNGDGILNILDFIAFQDAFTAGDRSADCNGDRVFNVLDFVCYQRLFQGGCP